MVNILMSRSILGQKEVYDFAKSYIKNHHQVVIVALSFFPNQVRNEEDYHKLYQPGSEYYQKIIDQFIPYGIVEKQIDWINYYQDNQQSAITKIEHADIIYLPGGAPDLMIERIIEMGLKEKIESHQGIFIGSSAGTMIQFKDYYISKDHDYHRFSYEKGLNLLSGFFVEVHYRRRKKQKSSMRKVFRAYKEDIYSIPDDGIIIVDDQRIIPLLSSKRIYHRTGIER